MFAMEIFSFILFLYDWFYTEIILLQLNFRYTDNSLQHLLLYFLSRLTLVFQTMTLSIIEKKLKVKLSGL